MASTNKLTTAQKKGLVDAYAKKFEDDQKKVNASRTKQGKSRLPYKMDVGSTLSAGSKNVDKRLNTRRSQNASSRGK